MAYRVFISTTDEPEAREYAQAVKAALWRTSDFAMTAITLEDVGQLNPAERLEAARGIITDADVFIGLYGAHYGDVPAGETASNIELEYEWAMAQGKPCLIFVVEDAQNTSDERMQAFRVHLASNHVINVFSTPEDLQAKVLVALAKVKHWDKGMRVLRATSTQAFSPVDLSEELPPRPTPGEPLPTIPAAPTVTTQISQAAGEVPAPDDPFAASVLRALDIIDDELEQIVRRALDLHDAQRLVQPKPVEESEDTLYIRPLFGKPSTRSQFRNDVFMIMPFRDQFTSVYEKVIMPTCRELNLTIKRGDDFSSTTGSIIQEVWSAIYNCRIVIAEVSEMNANVYYELGIAHTLGKPTVLITQTEPEELPFDIRHLRFIHYANTIEGGEKLATELKHSVIWVLNDLKEEIEAGQKPAS